MTVFEQAAPGAIGPGLTAAALYGAAVLVSRRTGRARILDVGAGLAAAVGFGVGFAVILRWPRLPLDSGTDAFYWVAWIAVGAFLLGLLERLVSAPQQVRLAWRLAASLGAAWLLVEPLVPHALEAGPAWLRAGGAAFGMTLAWFWIDREARRPDAPGFVALPFMIAAGTTAAILAFLSNSLSMGQVTGGLSAALGAAFGLGWLLRTRAASVVSAPVIVLVFGSLLLAAYSYLNYGDRIHFPLASGILLLLGGLLGTMLPRWLGKDQSRVVGHLLSTIPPVVLSAVAAWIAHAGQPPPNPYG